MHNALAIYCPVPYNTFKLNLISVANNIVETLKRVQVSGICTDDRRLVPLVLQHCCKINNNNP